MMESRKKCTLISATFHTTLLSSLIIVQRVFLSSHKKITSKEFFQFIRVLCFYMACISSVQCTVLFFFLCTSYHHRRIKYSIQMVFEWTVPSPEFIGAWWKRPHFFLLHSISGYEKLDTRDKDSNNINFNGRVISEHSAVL